MWPSSGCSGAYGRRSSTIVRAHRRTSTRRSPQRAAKASIRSAVAAHRSARPVAAARRPEARHASMPATPSRPRRQASTRAGSAAWPSAAPPSSATTSACHRGAACPAGRRRPRPAPRARRPRPATPRGGPPPHAGTPCAARGATPSCLRRPAGRGGRRGGPPLPPRRPTTRRPRRGRAVRGCAARPHRSSSPRPCGCARRPPSPARSTEGATPGSCATPGDSDRRHHRGRRGSPPSP